ncbi:Gfo/Idh/MocA family protein [Polaribacter glomeratus]|uniref:Oxidoreductase n=1 Tax=Polaribacter glomeratus TaxID=102 RepID=A0A2S7WG54_9FLAO|nr:Gfo/Idh/MocA family oxidoreductase [Polaribacter glomeratus]PQJ76590.1 hypothetical protein BTO16_11885 [Polaribacter glomeratus]TXD67573.1 Gfo/Idh/MocA family oxidoreductase [Polaribacter glomeratus]
MKIDENVCWGIIGCGDVTELKSGPAFQKVEDSSLVAVMRRNEEKVKDFAERHHVKKWTTNASEIINDKSINAIYIATPPSTHLQYALQVLKANKNVYLEKPMVLNSIEAKILSDALKQSRSKLTIAHYRRVLPVFLTVKELLESNVIGHVSLAEITIHQSKSANLIAKIADNWRTNPTISGGGYFHDIGPHQIDLMVHYFGEVDTIIAVDLEKNTVSNDVVKGFVQFKNGIQFKGNWDFNAEEDKDNCTIYGMKGTISFSFYGDEIIIFLKGKQERYQFKNPMHVQQPMIEKTVGYFLGKNVNPCSIHEAAVVTQIMDVFCGIN